jgi:hypothetical protein
MSAPPRAIAPNLTPIYRMYCLSMEQHDQKILYDIDSTEIQELSYE